MKKVSKKLAALLAGCLMLTGCSAGTQIDDLEGSIAGALNSNEKNELADNILKRLDAQIVAENRDSDIFTIYAYSKGVGSYITIGDSKINMNIAIGYDEEQNRTEVYLSSPVNSLDY